MHTNTHQRTCGPGRRASTTGEQAASVCPAPVHTRRTRAHSPHSVPPLVCLGYALHRALGGPAGPQQRCSSGRARGWARCREPPSALRRALQTARPCHAQPRGLGPPQQGAEQRGGTQLQIAACRGTHVSSRVVTALGARAVQQLDHESLAITVPTQSRDIGYHTHSPGQSGTVWLLNGHLAVAQNASRVPKAAVFNHHGPELGTFGKIWQPMWCI